MSITSLTERYFQEKSSLHEALTAWKLLLEPAAHRIDPAAAILGRVKTYSSMLGKAYRKPSHVRQWHEFGDLVALKAIFPTTQGVDAFTDWLLKQAEWEPVLDHKELKPDEMKYRSEQFDLVSKEITDSTGQPIKIEVQVRTAASDAWYVVDHRLRYKGAVELPDELKRKLLRLIVLTELFDEEVKAVIEKQAEMPEYAVARTYDNLRVQIERLVDDQTRTSRPEGLLELLLDAYTPEEMEDLDRRLSTFVDVNEEALRATLMAHHHESLSYVEERDWIYYEPEVLMIAERSATKPALLRSKVEYSDFGGIIGPAIQVFILALA
ncbi:hypothetical protein ACLBWP_14620 [Microbacterium sp. M1A1_1b]